VGNLSIVVLITEGRQELGEHLVFGHLAGDNLGVLGAIVYAGEVASSDHIITIITVELGESFVDNGLAASVRAATDANKELIVGDEAIVVDIKAVEENASFLLREGAAHVLKAPVKLLLVKGAVLTIVNNFEGAANRANGLGTACV